MSELQERCWSLHAGVVVLVLFSGVDAWFGECSVDIIERGELAQVLWLR